MECGFRRGPPAEKVSATPRFSHELENGKVTEGLAGCTRDFPDDAEAAFAVDEDTFLFPPAGGRQHEVGELGCFGRRIHFLHDEKIEFREEVARAALIDPRVRGIGRDHPEAADFAAFNCVQNLVICVAGAIGNLGRRKTDQTCDVISVVRLGEIVTAK